MTGFLLINKPPGPTSHDIINQLRKITGIKKIGHAGTLDPIADGLLIVAIGRESTKKIDNFVKLDKTYLATLKLGATSKTYDSEGKIEKIDCQKPKLTEIKKVLSKFIGQQEQLPPMYSAKKVGGQKLYQLARQEKTIKRKKQKINIKDIKLIKYNWPNLSIEVNCSSGTYIRSLADDIGQSLKCGAYLKKLTRTSIDRFQLKNAIKTDQLNKNNWQKKLIREKKKVLAAGTFDILHPGHLNFFKQAKKLGDQLFVIVSRDKNVEKLKGKLPKNNEEKRLKKIEKQNLIDRVYLGDLSNQLKIVAKINPDIIALGYDQKVNIKDLQKKLKQKNLKPQIIRLKPFQEKKYKSHLLT